MTTVLAATESGCRLFSEARENAIELAGHKISALAPEADGACIAVVDEREIWRRSATGQWSKVTAVDIVLQSITSSHGVLYCGGMDEATIFRVPRNGEPERLTHFDHVAGRSEWFAGGPPLGVRSLTAASDGKALLAAVHVGGIPRSDDGGETWTPTIPILFDIHEVRNHPSLPDFVAGAAAVGLCISHDGGKHWDVIADSLTITNSLAVAVLESEVLFSIQDGPFAKQSQIWRWSIGSGELQPARDGLPEWMEGKVDTAQIASDSERAAICDGGGNLWLSQERLSGWKCIAKGLGYVSGLLIIERG